MSGWMPYVLGVLTLPGAWALYVAAVLGWERAVKAVRARQRKPASEMAHGISRAIGEEGRRISQRFIFSWRWRRKWQWQLMLFKEGPKEPTKTWFWPEGSGPSDDEESG